jgi:asparagine synthase (glutamine-hydrolysing)
MFAHAKGAGCRIMNDGIDGDLVTHAPNRYMASWIAEGDWLGAWSEVKLASKHHTYLSGNRPLSLFAKSVWDVYAPSGIVAFRRKFTHAGRRRAIGSSLIDEEFARRFCLEDKLFGLYDEMNRAENSGVQAAHIYFLTRPGLASSMDLYGSAAAPYGIESRHPWSDRRLVEFYLKLPMNQKSRAGWTKYLVRKSLDGYVDTDIVWNSRKDHLLMRMVRAIMKNSREQIEAARGSMGEVLSGIVDAKRVDALFTKDDMSNDELFDLYKLVSYQVWSKRIQAKRESPVFRKR